MADSSRAATLIIVAVAVLGVARPALTQSRGERAESTRLVAVPFTLQTETHSFASSPLGELVVKNLIARRSEGTTVTVETLFPDKLHQRVNRSIQYLDGHNVVLVDAVAAKTVLSRKQDAARRNQLLLNPPADCVFASHENLIGKASVLGHPVDVVSASFTHTAWRAPDLGCETLQSREGYKHNGGFMLTAEIRAVGLKLGEPDSQLFDEGTNYAEVKPSELLRRQMAAAGIPWDENMQRDADRADRLYLPKP